MIAVPETLRRRGLTGVEWLAATSLLTLALAAFLKQSVGNTALGLLLLLTMADAERAWRAVRGEPWFWWTAGYVAFIGGYALYLGRYGHGGGKDIADAAVDYLKVAFLPGLIVGYWVYRSPRLVPFLLGLLPLGMMVRVFSLIDRPELHALFSGRHRATFGNSAVLFGLWSLVIVVLGAHLLITSIRQYAGYPRTARLAGVMGGLVVTAFGVLGLAFSQTRTAWLLAVVAIPLHLVLLGVINFRRRRRGFRAVGLVIASFLLALTAFMWWFSGPVSQRLEKMDGSVAAIVQGDWQAVPDDSVLLRLKMFREAWDEWQERPVLGWGLGSDEFLLAHSQQDRLRERGFYHFHNDYLIFLAECGLVGAILVAALFLVPLGYTLGEMRRGDRQPLGATLFVVLLIIAGGAATDRVLTSSRAPYVMALVVGIAVGMRLIHRHAAPRNSMSGATGALPCGDVPGEEQIRDQRGGAPSHRFAPGRGAP